MKTYSSKQVEQVLKLINVAKEGNAAIVKGLKKGQGWVWEIAKQLAASYDEEAYNEVLKIKRQGN